MSLRMIAAGVALFASSAMAEDARNFTGFWNLDFGAVPEIPEDMVAALPSNTVVIADTGVPEFPKDEYGGLRLRPEALAKAQEWEPADEMTLSRVCASPSIVYSIQGPFPFEIHQAPGLVVFKYEYFDQVRLVFTDGRSHPPADAPHSKMGHSIGHWENGDLVIDTTHIAPSTITNNGLDHSANIRMVERYRLSEDGTTLSATQWFEDPEVLENNGARLIQWTKQPGQYVYPYDCDPSIAVEYMQLDGGNGNPEQ